MSDFIDAFHLWWNMEVKLVIFVCLIFSYSQLLSNIISRRREWLLLVYMNQLKRVYMYDKTRCYGKWDVYDVKSAAPAWRLKTGGKRTDSRRCFCLSCATMTPVLPPLCTPLPRCLRLTPCRLVTRLFIRALTITLILHCLLSSSSLSHLSVALALSLSTASTDYC